MNMYEDIARIIVEYYKEEILAEPLTSAGDIEKAKSNIAKKIKKQLDQPILPLPGESLTVCSSYRKTAALFFDKIWWPPLITPHCPHQEIIFYGATEFEIWLQAVAGFINRKARERLLGVTAGEIDYGKLIKLCQGTPFSKVFESKDHHNRLIAEALFMEKGLIATPVYNSIESLSEEYKPGNKMVIFAAITNIGIVDENKLEWAQVMEFRKDPAAQKKYRRMIHWLDTEMVGKTTNFISDRIANKLEDYEWALKKHGIETITGCLSRIIDPQFIAASSAAVTGLFLAGDQFIATIGGLGLLAGKAAISITKSALDIIDKRRGKDSEIAFVYDMKKKLK